MRELFPNETKKHIETNQIRGCITEIEIGGHKVFIDFG
jgi:hypothetical protein